MPNEGKNVRGSLVLDFRKLPVTNFGLSSTSDVITFDQNWHHPYSPSAEGKDLSNDAQISGWPNGALDMH